MENNAYMLLRRIQSHRNDSRVMPTYVCGFFVLFSPRNEISVRSEMESKTTMPTYVCGYFVLFSPRNEISVRSEMESKTTIVHFVSTVKDSHSSCCNLLITH